VAPRTGAEPHRAWTGACHRRHPALLIDWCDVGDWRTWLAGTDRDRDFPREATPRQTCAAVSPGPVYKLSGIPGRHVVNRWGTRTVASVARINAPKNDSCKHRRSHSKGFAASPVAIAVRRVGSGRGLRHDLAPETTGACRVCPATPWALRPWFDGAARWLSRAARATSSMADRAT